MIDYINVKEINGGLVVEQYKLCSSLYIITRIEGKYRLYKIDEEGGNPKKICESKNANDLHERIPDY